jgi:hypothetical protein
MGWTIRVLLLVEAIDFTLSLNFQTDPGAHPPSYFMGPGGKMAGV